MPFSTEYVSRMIVKIACDTTGDDPQELIDRGTVSIPPRDAIEFVVRLEAEFDCILHRLRFEYFEAEVDELARQIVEATMSSDRV